MALWFELVGIASSIQFIDEDDSPVWNLNSKGVYTVSSFYKFINFRGVSCLLLLLLFGHLKSPQYSDFSLPLVNNKLLTRDNLSKRQEVGDPSCVFCSEQESCSHLFSCCVVAVEFWKAICAVTGVSEDINMMSISSYWLRGDKFAAINTVHAAGLWAIWKTRNDMVFNNVCWPGLQAIWRRTTSNLSMWECFSLGCARDKLGWAMKELETKARSPPLLLAPPHLLAHL